MRKTQSAESHESNFKKWRQSKKYIKFNVKMFFS